MNWTVYTLGDVTLYHNILNAVAAVFNSTVFTSDTGGIGGAGMLPAFLVGLMLVLAGAVKAQVTGSNQNSIAVFMLLIVFWMVGVGTKERVQVEDIYTGSITAIDNVPLLVAAPASIVSTFSYRIGSLMQQAFSSVNTSYVEMTTAGFVNPLRLFLSLRNMSSSAPYLTASMQIFIRDCSLGFTDYSSLIQSNDAVAYLTDSNNYRNGLTTYFPASTPAGIAVPCATAASNIRDSVESAFSTSTGSLVTRLMNKNMPERAPGSTTTAYSWTADSYADGPHKAVQVALSTTQSAQQAMTNLMAGSYISDSFRCGTSAFDQDSYAQCANLSLESSDLYAVDATASASFFGRLMMPAMTLLSALFFALAPLVVFICLMANMQGLQLLTKYLLFGAWTQSFLPVAHVINFFIQSQFQDGLRKLASAGANGLTVEYISEVYAMASTRIAFASDLMAATPMLTLMLFTGSYYALTNIAGRLGGKDTTDERQIVAPIAKQDAIASVTGLAAGGAGAVGSTPGASGASYSVAQAASHELSKLQGSLKEHGMQFGEKIASGLSASWGTSSSLDTYRRVDNAIQFGQGEGQNASTQILGSMSNGHNFSADQKTVMSGAVKAAAAMGLSVPLAKAAIEGMLQKSGQFSEGEARSLSSQFQDSASRGKSWEAFSRSTHSDSSGQNLSNVVTQGLQKTNQEGVERLKTESERISEQISTADRQINSGQLNRNYSDAQLMKQIKDHGLSGQVFAALERNGIAISDAATRASSHFTNPEDHQLNAAFLSLYSSGKGYGDAAGIISQVAGISGPGTANMDSTFKGAGTRDRVEAGVAGANVALTPELQNAVNNNSVGGITVGNGLRPPAPLPELTGGPSEESIRQVTSAPFNSAQKAEFDAGAGAMRQQFNARLPVAMGEYLGDVTGKAGDVLMANKGAALVYGAGLVGGGLYKINEKMIRSAARAGTDVGKFPLGDKVASGFRSVTSHAFASADEAMSVARGMAQGANAGRGFMVARAGLFGTAGAVAGAATAGYMVYEFSQKTMSMVADDAKAAGFGSTDAYLRSQLNPATTTLSPRGLGGDSKVPGAGNSFADRLPPAPGSTSSKK